ncbi:SDR family NAD(P)-dependent oxidoreductase [Streptomyces sp. NPDC002787]
MERLSSRRVFVTGAASGIGRATTLRLLEEGAAVVATDIEEEGLSGTADLAAKAGTGERLVTAALDVAEADAVDAVVGDAIATLGGLDALVNIAGMLRGAHTHQCSLELWNRVLAVNLTGTFLVTRAALPALLETGNGVVVNFSSTSAQFAHPYLAAYSASKGGILSLTHSIAQEYAKQGLRAVNVCPGGIASAMTENFASLVPEDTDWSLFAKLTPALRERYGSPEVVAAVVATLISDDGAFISGTEIRIDGGTHQ